MEGVRGQEWGSGVGVGSLGLGAAGFPSQVSGFEGKKRQASPGGLQEMGGGGAEVRGFWGVVGLPELVSSLGRVYGPGLAGSPPHSLRASPRPWGLLVKVRGGARV